MIVKIEINDSLLKEFVAREKKKGYNIKEITIDAIHHFIAFELEKEDYNYSECVKYLQKL